MDETVQFENEDDISSCTLSSALGSTPQHLGKGQDGEKWRLKYRIVDFQYMTAYSRFFPRNISSVFLEEQIDALFNQFVCFALKVDSEFFDLLISYSTRVVMNFFCLSSDDAFSSIGYLASRLSHFQCQRTYVQLVRLLDVYTYLHVIVCTYVWKWIAYCWQHTSQVEFHKAYYKQHMLLVSQLSYSIRRMARKVLLEQEIRYVPKPNQPFRIA